jgi:hypothetical protein
MFWQDGLTPVERAVQGMQVAEERCAVCLHRGREVFDGEFICTKGLCWPKGAPRCAKFKLDEAA